VEHPFVSVVEPGSEKAAQHPAWWGQGVPGAVETWFKAGWLMGRNAVTHHPYGCEVSGGVGPVLAVWESPRAGRAVCGPQP